MSDPLYRLIESPDLVEPPMIMALDGWVDASSAANQAIEHLRDTCEMTLVAAFDANRLLDHRARRPIMHLVDGVNTGITWPKLSLEAAIDPRGREFLLLNGPEPDHEWPNFAAAVVALCHELGVVRVVGLGAYPAAVPHTRDINLTSTASTQELADSYGFVNATIDVPAGIQAVIERVAADEGIPSIGIWAQVPHYASGMEYPAASAALLEMLAKIANIVVETTTLHEASIRARSRLNDLLEGNPEHLDMLAKLEAHVDALAQTRDVDIPTGEQLAEDFQAFLRDSEGEDQ